MIRAAVFVTLTVLAAALRVDPIAWTTALDAFNESSPPNQWLASSGDTLIVMAAANVASLHPMTGKVLWVSTLEGLDPASTFFDTSAAAVVVVCNGTTVFGLNATTGALYSTAQLSGGANPGINSVIAHEGVFVVSGGTSLGIFDSALTELYTMTVAFAMGTVGTAPGYVYFTYADDSSSSGFTMSLVIVNLTTFAQTQLDNVGTISLTSLAGNIMVMEPSDAILSCVSLESGEYVWRNKGAAKKMNTFGTFTLFPTTDMIVVVADNNVFGFDPTTGAEVFQYASPFDTINAPTIASGRLVYIGAPSQPGVPALVTVDLSTGAGLGQVVAPGSTVPTLSVVANNAMMMNGQGYTAVNILTMKPESYNLKLPGANAIATFRPITNTSATTFVLVGLLGATAVHLQDV